MRHYHKIKISIWLLVLCLAISLLVGCTTELEEEGTTPTEEESQAEIELELLQAEYDELRADYDALENQLEAKLSEYSELSASQDELRAQYNELDTEYSELSDRYEELRTKYDALIYEPETITEAEVEQAVFNLINQERIANGLPDLLWGENLHWWAKQHSEYMKGKKILEYSTNDQVFWQDVFRGVSYGTAEKTAKAALTMWKDNQYFAKNFLATQTEYGAVAVSKSGEVFYITYFAAVQP